MISIFLVGSFFKEKKNDFFVYLSSNKEPTLYPVRLKIANGTVHILVNLTHRQVKQALARRYEVVENYCGPPCNGINF